MLKNHAESFVGIRLFIVTRNSELGTRSSETLPVYAALRYWGVLVLFGCLFKSNNRTRSGGAHLVLTGCLFNSELGTLTAYGFYTERTGPHEGEKLLTPPQTECSRLIAFPLTHARSLRRVSSYSCSLKAHAVSFTLPVYAVLRYWGVLVLSGCLFKSEIGNRL